MTKLLRLGIYFIGCMFHLSTSSALLLTSDRAPGITASKWKADAANHINIMDDLLYPPGDSLKARTHLVKQHPIYNFLHTYYRYSTSNVKKYSPGLGILLNSCNEEDISDASDSSTSTLLNSKYLKITAHGYFYELPKLDSPDGPFGWITLSKTRNILHSTASRQPFYGCFGLHEWAMLYSGRRDNSNKVKPRHQDLPLRVSQDIIDDTVESSHALKCTHYDAFRFFHPSAQPLNSVSILTRDFQEENEQPGCVHAAMDLFKYAYQLYPFISSELLRDCLILAIKARKIDMRASPYDVSGVKECSGPICVETPEGRRIYVLEQEELSLTAAPIRLKLLEAYEQALAQLKS